jgi:hypothetical protein
MEPKDLKPYEQAYWSGLRTYNDKAAYMAWLERTRYPDSSKPEHQPPTEVGMYLTSWRNFERYSWWNGAYWMYTTRNINRAYEERTHPSSSTQDRAWKKAEHPSWAREVPADNPVIERGPSPAEFFANRNKMLRAEMNQVVRAEISQLGMEQSVERCIASLKQIKGASPRRTARADPRLLLGEVK